MKLFGLLAIELKTRVPHPIRLGHIPGSDRSKVALYAHTQAGIVGVGVLMVPAFHDLAEVTLFCDVSLWEIEKNVTGKMGSRLNMARNRG